MTRGADRGGIGACDMVQGVTEIDGGRTDGPARMPAPPRDAVYDSPGRLLDWRHSAKGGMTVDLFLVVFGPHPFRNLPFGKERGQRLRVMCTTATEAGAVHVAYRGEAILIRWAEAGETGKMIRLMLDDGPDGATGQHPFFGLAHGKLSGEPLHLWAVAIDDDESEIPPGKFRKRDPFQSLSEVRQCNILCRDVRFRRYMRDNLDRYVKSPEVRDSLLRLPDTPDGFGAAVTRAALGIATRAVMNQDNPEAATARRRWRGILSAFSYEAHLG